MSMAMWCLFVVCVCLIVAVLWLMQQISDLQVESRNARRFQALLEGRVARLEGQAEVLQARVAASEEGAINVQERVARLEASNAAPVPPPPTEPFPLDGVPRRVPWHIRRAELRAAGRKVKGDE